MSEEASRITSHGSFESDDGDVGCIHIDESTHSGQHEEMQDDHGFDKIDPELEAILGDALMNFRIYSDVFTSVRGSSTAHDVIQLPKASEDVQISCKPNDCGNVIIDAELDAILGSTLEDFVCMKNAPAQRMSDLTEKEEDVCTRENGKNSAWKEYVSVVEDWMCAKGLVFEESLVGKPCEDCPHMMKIEETLDECLMLPKPLLDGQQIMHNGLEQVLPDKGNQ